MYRFHSCLICHAKKVHEHHVIKRKVEPNSDTVYLCPKHHKLADLGRISVLKLRELARVERIYHDLLWVPDMRYQRWEVRYFLVVLDYLPKTGINNGISLLMFVRGFDYCHYMRLKRVLIWLGSGSRVGMYLVGFEMFSYLKKSA
jgi:hypothetical protein